MDTFWKWLMRANARVVLLCAVLALCIVAAWWAWQLSRPVGFRELLTSRPIKERREADLGVMVLLQAERERPEPETLPCAFRGKDMWKYYHVATSAAVQPDNGGPPSGSGASQRVRHGRVVSPSSGVRTPRQPGTVAAKQEPVSLVFRGIFTRSDGRTVVLIEDSLTKSGIFYEAGQDIFGMKVKGMGVEEVTLAPSDGASLTLKRGQSVLLGSSKNAD